jgi:hypothetical protein
MEISGWRGTHTFTNPWVFTSATGTAHKFLARDGSPIQDQYCDSWRKTWRLPVILTCPLHHRLLEHLCRSCKQPAMSASASLIPSSAASIRPSAAPPLRYLPRRTPHVVRNPPRPAPSPHGHRTAPRRGAARSDRPRRLTARSRRTRGYATRQNTGGPRSRTPTTSPSRTKEIYERAQNRIIKALGGLLMREMDVPTCDRMIKTVRKNHGPSAAKTTKSVLSLLLAMAVRMARYRRTQYAKRRRSRLAGRPGRGRSASRTRTSPTSARSAIIRSPPGGTWLAPVRRSRRRSPRFR